MQIKTSSSPFFLPLFDLFTPPRPSSFFFLFPSLACCQENLPLKGQFCTEWHRQRLTATDAITVSVFQNQQAIALVLSTCLVSLHCYSFMATLIVYICL